MTASVMLQERVAWQAWAVLVVGTAAALFVGGGLIATHGVWPAPLDDTYIYYGCAKSFALGAPFAWYPGNGYSSGCTSILYPMLLAPLWAAGMRGTWLGLGATLLAVGALLDLCRSLRLLSDRHPASWLYPLMIVAVPLLSWSWFSGMETAVLGALLGRSLLAAQRTQVASREERARRQLHTGAWLAALALMRPETVPFIAAVALAVAYRGGALPVWRSLAASAGPAVLFLGAQATANRLLTGEWSQAGAVRKALWSSPHVAEPDVALSWVKNLLVIVDQALIRGLGGTVAALALPLLVLAALLDGKHRLLALSAVLGAAGSVAVICLNSTARFQNYRYAAPTSILIVIAAALGVHALARRRLLWPIGAVLAALGVLAPATQARLQLDHFARASANIVEQHVEVARRLRALSPAPRRVLVNDAGVIPYLTDIRPIDAFGLGGYRGMPFARASVHGQAAVVELIERLPSRDRPDVMALYPNWWGDVARGFGRRIDSVRIDDNVICGNDEKVIYAADWRSLADPAEADPGVIDVLDVADLISEREHGFRFPAPDGGWVVGEARYQGRRRRYDGGRVIPAARAMSFRVTSGAPVGPATLRVRTASATTLRVTVWRDGLRLSEALAVATGPPSSARWPRIEAKLVEVGGGDRIEIVGEATFQAYSVWLRRP